jgi:hypothetical protein
MSSWANFFSVALAGLAALLWLFSAAVNIPVIGSAYGAISNLEPFYAAMKNVARLNGAAAFCAFLSAAAQAISLQAPIWLRFSGVKAQWNMAVS